MLKALWQKHSLLFLFFAIMLGGLFVRMVFIEYQGLSNDELSAWSRASLPWGTFFETQVKIGDMHPFFYQLLFKIWLGLFGSSDWGVRSLSLLFYVLNFTLLYKIAQLYFGSATAIWTAVFFAFSGFLIVNQSTSRPYNSALFFVLASLLFSMRWIKEQQLSWGRIVLLGLSITGALLSHYFAGLVVALLGVVLFFYLHKAERKKWLAMVGVSVVCFLPHLGISWFQFNQGGLGWLDAPEYTWFFDFLIRVLQNSLWWALLFVLMSFLLIWNTGKLSKLQSFVGLTLVLIVAVSWMISLVLTPILRELVFQFIWPFVSLFVFSFLEKKLPKERAYLSFVPLLFILTLFGYPLTKRIHYGEFEALVKQEEIFTRRGAGLVIENAINPSYLRFYSGVKRSPVVQDWAGQDAPYRLAGKIRETKEKKVFYLWTNNINLPIFWEIMRLKFPYWHVSSEFFNSGYMRFYENAAQIIRPEKVSVSFVKEVVDSSEFFFEHKISVAKISPYQHSSGYFSLQLELDGKVDQNCFLVVTIDRNGEMLLKNDQPVLYTAYSNEVVPTDENILVNAFQLPASVLSTDVLKMYVWNPGKNTVKIKKAELLSIRPYLTK